MTSATASTIDKTETKEGPKSQPAALKGGIVTALVTPFTRDGHFDEGAFARLIDFQIDAGIHALFALGTSGEGLICSADERKDIAEAAISRIAGRRPAVIHVGATDTTTAAELAAHAHVNGASAIAVLPPMFYDYDDTELRAHFMAVAEASGGIDNFIYNNPARVGYGLSPAIVASLVHDIEAIKGVKDTGDSLARVMSYLNGSAGLSVYVGNNVLVTPALSIGAAGAVSTLANACPELFVALYDAARSGAIERAKKLQYVVVRLQAAMAGLPLIAGTKSLLKLRGLLSDTTSHSPMAQSEAAQESKLFSRVRADAELQHWLTTA